MKQTYNGWKNKATWIVNLYMNNDEGNYTWINEMISTHLKGYGDIYFAPSDELLWEITEVLKDDISELLLPIYFERQGGVDVSRTMTEDLLSLVLSEVDWFELAKKHTVDWIETNETQPTK